MEDFQPTEPANTLSATPDLMAAVQSSKRFKVLGVKTNAVVLDDKADDRTLLVR